MTFTVSDLNDREKFVWNYIRTSPYANKVSEEEYLSAIEHIHSGTRYPYDVSEKVRFLAPDTIAVVGMKQWHIDKGVLNMILEGLDFDDKVQADRLYHVAAELYALITIPTQHHIYCIDHGKIAATFTQ